MIQPLPLFTIGGNNNSSAWAVQHQADAKHHQTWCHIWWKQVRKTCPLCAITQNRMAPLIDVFWMNHRRAVPESYRGGHSIFFLNESCRQVPGSYGQAKHKIGYSLYPWKDGINIEFRTSYLKNKLVLSNAFQRLSYEMNAFIIGGSISIHFMSPWLIFLGRITVEKYQDSTGGTEIFATIKKIWS